jgi:putative membrane protein
VAVDLRARILAGHHGLDQATPEPTPQAMATVPTRQLVISAVLSSATGLAFGWLVIFVIIIVGAGSSSAAPTTAGVGTLLLSLYGFVRNTWRRVTSQYGFSVGLAPDGVRKIQPLVWRMFDWCRLEVDVAGASGEERGSRSSSVTKALLPVGRTEVADALFSSLLGLRQFPLAKPPERARWKALLSYHFLSAASDGAVVAATTGRFRKVTIWIPLEKAQSIRWAEGPVQRPFGLATVYVDAAGRRATAELRDRGTEEAAALFHQLVLDSRAARQRADHRSPPPVPSLPLPSPSLPSPSVPSPAAPVLTPPGAAVVSMGQPGPPPAANGRTRGPTNGGPGDS